MTFNDYLAYTARILSGELEMTPYTDESYFEYTKLNQTRMKRWMKTGELSEETIKTIKSITERQKWIVISEPWCGDASHILPFVHKMAELSNKIELDIELRDSKPFRIDNYLTGTSKSIPILIVRNKHGEDLFVWGPRPTGVTELRLKLLEEATSSDQVKEQMQKWYNEDKGNQIQEEIVTRLQSYL